MSIFIYISAYFAVVISGLVSLCYAANEHNSGESTGSTERVYDAGPLTKDDFPGEPPRQLTSNCPKSHDAWLQTRIRYSYNTSSEASKQDVIVKLKSFSSEAIVVKQESWNRRPENAILLEHEQGHFDAMQIEALKWQQSMQQSITENKSVFRARTQEEAERLLKQMLDDELALRLKAARAAEDAFDNLKSPRGQAKYREFQKQQLRTLSVKK